MICPVCQLHIGLHDGVATNGTTTVHVRCHGKRFVEPRPSDEALVAAIASMLADRVDEPVKLAREISQVLLSRFSITERKRT